MKNKYNNRSYYLRYEDYMNYNVDNRLIICFQSNKEFAYNNKIKVIHKLGIPGIYSPKSSGIAIAEDLLNLITHKLT